MGSIASFTSSEQHCLYNSAKMKFSLCILVLISFSYALGEEAKAESKATNKAISKDSWSTNPDFHMGMGYGYGNGYGYGMGMGMRYGYNCSSYCFDYPYAKSFAVDQSKGKNYPGYGFRPHASDCMCDPYYGCQCNDYPYGVMSLIGSKSGNGFSTNPDFHMGYRYCMYYPEFCRGMYGGMNGGMYGGMYGGMNGGMYGGMGGMYGGYYPY